MVIHPYAQVPPGGFNGRWYLRPDLGLDLVRGKQVYGRIFGRGPRMALCLQVSIQSGPLGGLTPAVEFFKHT